MDPANVRECLREVRLDEEEGADWLMVKPGLPYADVIRAVSEISELPIAAYHVSGEFASLKAAAQNGWLDFDRCLLESLLCLRRAGADIIFTYGAIEAARLLKKGKARPLRAFRRGAPGALRGVDHEPGHQVQLRARRSARSPDSARAAAVAVVSQRRQRGRPRRSRGAPLWAVFVLRHLGGGRATLLHRCARGPPRKGRVGVRPESRVRADDVDVIAPAAHHHRSGLTLDERRPGPAGRSNQELVVQGAPVDLALSDLEGCLRVLQVAVRREQVPLLAARNRVGRALPRGQVAYAQRGEGAAAPGDLEGVPDGDVCAEGPVDVRR
ncbi:MAG: hypothetical protein IT375_02810 [Polyangiaceae bacterium]|nr:hypothetical protein [Polyangiaceae bacterium]